MNPGMDGQLPEIYDAELTPERLEDLLADIEAQATWTEVRVREGAEGLSRVGSIGIAELGQRLAASSQCSAQVRYGFEGRDWCDSILRTSEGFRLVRMALVRPDSEGDPEC